MSTIAAGTTLTTALVETGDTTGNLVIQTNGTTTAATFDTSQNLTVVNNVTATGVSVGIGSNTAPSITFTGDTNTGIYSPTADTIAFTEGGVEAGRFTSTGALQLNNNLTFSGTGNRITGDFSNATVANRVIFQTSTTNGVTQIQAMPNGTATQSQFTAINGTDPNNASGVQIRVNATEASIMGYNTGTGAALPLNFLTNGSERMRIDTSGNVGIGTSSASTFGKFVVQTSTSANTPIVAVTDSGLSPQLNHYITDSGSTVRNLNQIGFNTGSSNSANYQGFMTFSTMASAGGTISERMRIDASGNVGIGTSSPSGRLHVASSSGGLPLYVTSSASAQNVRIRLNSSDTASSVSYVWSYSDASLNKQASIYLTSTGALATQVGQTAGAEPTTGTTAMLIDSSGNVGIGTASPNYKIQIKAATNQNFGIGGAVSLSNAVALSAVNDANSANVPIEMRYATNIAWYDGGTERMRIDSSGNLQFNSGYGSVATAYGCRAWVNFNGTGTPAIRASGNVTSITDNGTGNYRVNFTNNMPDANYSVSGMSKKNDGSTDGFISMGGTGITDPSVSSCAILTFGASSSHDALYVCAAFFR